MKKKNILLGAIAAIALCVCTLVGATYAWLTDTAVSSNNVVKSGSLTVGVEYSLDGETWRDLKGADDLFKDIIWEPGYTKVIALRITNKGNVALKYSYGINFVGETAGTNKSNEEYKLSQYLNCATAVPQAWNEEGDNTAATTYLAAMFKRENVNSENWLACTFEKLCEGVNSENDLTPGQAIVTLLQIRMPETVGNEVNALTPDDVSEIEMGIKVIATQASVEEDTFGKDYDEGAQL